ncbi:MAG: hypothetical protein JO297_06340 [Nitrososphaeraceae archaeon]|nr:hypothetical protein [Nitrososphaeraceae archaeon]
MRPLSANAKNSNSKRWRSLSWFITRTSITWHKRKKINELYDLQEFENLIENIKQTYFQDYKTRYDKQTEEIDCIIPFK